MKALRNRIGVLKCDLYTFPANLSLATLESIINCDQGNLCPNEVLDGSEKYHSDETIQMLSPPQDYIPNATKDECRDIIYSIETSTITSPITPMTPPDHESSDIIEADLYAKLTLQVRIFLTASEGINYISTEYTLSRQCSTRAGTSPGHRDSTNQLLTSACNLQCGHLQLRHLPIYSTCESLSTAVRGPVLRPLITILNLEVRPVFRQPKHGFF